MLSTTQKEVGLAWAAGFFDGEGCVSRQNPHRAKSTRIRLTVGQQDDEVLLKFQEIVGYGNLCYPKTLKPNGLKWGIYLTITSWAAAQEVMQSLWPYLGSIKRARWVELGGPDYGRN